MFRKPLILTILLLSPLSPAQETLAFPLFREMAIQNTGRSFVFSPLGITRCLEKLKEGTAGDTAKELQNLRLGNSFSAKGSNITPRLSEAIFADDTLPLRSGAVQIRRIPLSQNREKAISAINSWSSGVTEGRIPALLRAGELSPNSRLLVLNTVFLNEPWQYAFDADSTHKQTFTRADGSSVQVDMLDSGETAFRAAGGKNWRAVALPYRNAESAERPVFFIAILPRADAAGFAGHLTQQKLDIILRKLAPQDEDEAVTCTIRLPRFSTYGMLCNLTPALKKLGLQHIFTQSANFSPWTDHPGLALDAICQKACIEVREQGTIAAAATYADCDEEGEFEQEQLVLNRPFVWLISELAPGSTPLFMGVWEGED